MADVMTAKEVLDKLSSLVPCEKQEPKDTYRIGDLAREFNLSLRTLRFYEDRGLLQPHRSGSTRVYSFSDRQRLKVILFAKYAGFALSDIEDILRLYDGESVTGDGVDYIMAKLRNQLGVLEKQRAELDKAINELRSATEEIKADC